VQGHHRQSEQVLRLVPAASLSRTSLCQIVPSGPVRFASPAPHCEASLLVCPQPRRGAVRSTAPRAPRRSLEAAKSCIVGMFVDAASKNLSGTGSPAGAILLCDLRPRAAHALAFPRTNVSGTLYFAIRRASLWCVKQIS
jgi:hypothetical protein